MKRAYLLVNSSNVSSSCAPLSLCELVLKALAAAGILAEQLIAVEVREGVDMREERARAAPRPLGEGMRRARRSMWREDI